MARREGIAGVCRTVKEAVCQARPGHEYGLPAGLVG